MMYTDHFLFWPVIIFIGIIIAICSARLVLRLALFIIGVLIIWYALAFVGLVPEPQNFFKKLGNTEDTQSREIKSSIEKIKKFKHAVQARG